MDSANDADSQSANQLVVYDPNAYDSESPNEGGGLYDTEDPDNGNVMGKSDAFYLEPGTPYVGMQFSTDDEAYEFYNAYAKRIGFGIRRSLSARGKDGEVIRRMFVCSKEGFKIGSDGNGRVVKRPRSGKQGCAAHMSIQKGKDGDGVWRIKYFNEKHNHELISSPSKIAMFRSHREDRLPPGRKPLPVDHFRDNISSQQPVGHLGLNKTSNVSRECIAVIQRYVEHKKTEESYFYYDVQFDKENKFRSVFWADGRARMSYMQFSDVVVFDTSYKAKGFLLPFASFTGVNHHKQPTLFACALLADEREETFEWLLETFLTCMWEKAPGAIISDHDPALCNAIKEVFPNTRHRYCMWHIGLDEDQHLSGLRSAYDPSFDEDYEKWVRKTQNVEEAESRWLSLKEKYKRDFIVPLTENQENEIKSWNWLESMYDRRHHWVEAYLMNTFFAGMKSSQGSQSTNPFFDGFVNSMTPLHELVVQYDKALTSGREKEDTEDTFCSRAELDFHSLHELEAFAGRVYTRNKFSDFQSEFRSTSGCFHEKAWIVKGFTVYKVVSRINSEVGVHFVKCKVSDKIFLCTCSKFETEGILCKHVMYIMKRKLNLQSIPERYILARWTPSARLTRTDFRRSLTDFAANGGDVTSLETSRLREKVNMIVEKASQDRLFYDIALKLVDDLLKQVDLFEQGATKSNTEESMQDGSGAAGELGSLLVEKAKNKGQSQEARGIPSGVQTADYEAQSRRRTRSKKHQNM